MDLDKEDEISKANHSENVFAESTEVVVEDESREKLVYNVSDRPPIHLTIFFAFQQALLSLAGNLATSLFVADVACADDFPEIKTNLLSSTLFMSGITTLLMSLFGIGLPLFQGSAGDFIIPLVAMKMIDKNLCSIPGIEDDLSRNNNSGSPVVGNTTMTSLFNDNLSSNSLVDMKRDFALVKLREFQGSLLLAGSIQFLVGLTGAVGLLLRFVGPVTVVPTILLSGIFISKAASKFCKGHWGVTFLTAATSMILSLYLGHRKMPIPAWSKKKGFYWHWYPLHQVFSILIGILVGWLISWILTETDMLTDDPESHAYLTRTDAREGAIKDASWFRVPYPNQFGAPSFSVAIFVAFLIGTITSIIDSIGDYYACARICKVPPPPRHSVNRGIAIEGMCSIFAGALGCGHATTTYGGNIGAIGVTKVASKDVFVGVGIIYIVFGLIGKITAVFITIPYPVLGGAMIVMYGMFNGIVLSNLQALSLSSTRNLAIIGTGLLMGLMIPYWLETDSEDINTGNPANDHIIKTLLSNPNFCGGIIACFLDNTVPEFYNMNFGKDDDTSTENQTESAFIKSTEVVLEDESREKLVYNVSDRPPIHLTIFFAFQQALLSLAGNLLISLFVADVACADDFPDIKTHLLSSTLFMSGLTTLLMSLFGIGLPVFQGASGDFIIPLIAMKMVDKNVCVVPGLEDLRRNQSDSSMTDNINVISSFNDTSSSNLLVIMKKEFAMVKLREFQGSLMLAGSIQFLVGLTGAVGLLLRFIGPVTVVPAILLSGIFISKATAKFCKGHWGVTFLTAATSIILSLYLGHRKMPIPAWSKKKGFYWYWYPLHQVFSILIGILIGWLISWILTETSMLTNNPETHAYLTRTDAREGVIKDASWFRVPYPNQFGTPLFSVAVFVAFLIGTIASIIDSIGDYYACARICKVPPPPRHGVNRGIAVEGMCSIIAATLGCGHATSTYGGNIGAIGVTKVASRDVFVGVGIIYIVFGVIGKISAVFITIPYPVLGGAMVVMFGMLNGIILSNLQALSLSSTRNLAIIGTALLMGLMIPYWLETDSEDINTGNPANDHIIKTLLSNPNFCGGIVACFLDNTVPGTKDERGITSWQETVKTTEISRGSLSQYNEGYGLYNPPIPKRLLATKIFKYIPILPDITKNRNNQKIKMRVCM